MKNRMLKIAARAAKNPVVRKCCSDPDPDLPRLHIDQFNSIFLLENAYLSS
jgi:hypothetical protein